MLHKLLRRVSRLSHKSEFETYLGSLNEARRSGGPTRAEAKRDFQTAARYKMLTR